MPTINELMSVSLPPSWFVKNTRVYKSWCSITVCPDCGQRAKYEDQHPVNPCMSCGSTVQEKVGRWSSEPRKWWEISKLGRGAWFLREEINQ